MCEFIEGSETLMHLNLSGMGISSQHMLKLAKAISFSKTLVGVHLSANFINECSIIRQEICQILGMNELPKKPEIDREF